MVADQFQSIVNSFEEAGRLDLELADLPHRVVVQPPDDGEPPTAFFGAYEPVSGFEPVVQTVVDMAKLQKLYVCKFDDFERVSAVRIDDHASRPVEDDEVAGCVGEAQPGCLANLVAAQRLGLEPHQPGNPVSPVLEPFVLAFPELKDDVFFAQVADREVVYRRANLLDPGTKQAPGGFGERGRLREPAGQLEKGAGRDVQMKPAATSEIAAKSNSVNSARDGRENDKSPGNAMPDGSSSTRIGAGR